MSAATTPTTAVHWDEPLGAFRVTGYAEAADVLRGPGWSSDPRRSPLVAPDIQDMPTGNLLFTDPPEHTRLRRLLSPAFTPRSIQDLRPRVAAIVDAVLDGLPGGGYGEAAGEIDILADLAYPATLAVIAELLDVGIEGAQVFADQTPNLIRMLEINATSDDLMAGAVASAEVTMFLTPILAERRQRPGNDFISALLALYDDSTDGRADGLTLPEVLATCVLILTAGHETTANLIANSTLALLTQPDQLPHLFADPGRATEELLRLHGAAKLIARTALTDHQIGGQHIATGQAVLIDIQQANRDPRHRPDPDRLDCSRTPTGHLAFGAGPHFCLGAALARLETAEALTRLFRRHPDLAPVSDTVHWRQSTAFHGLNELLVRVGPAGT
jgi:hypothetical protein